MHVFQRTQLVLYATVFTTGMAVLILEVAAVRVLTPVFGSTLYVLSSVLTTILLALSLGYFFGGRIADKNPYPLPLYGIITIGGLSILLSQILYEISLAPLDIVGSLVFGPLMFSIVLFFIPAFLLGMDSPYVITLLSKLTSNDHTGKYAGTTFFWSTIGSITGSLASGFFLLPIFGVSSTIIGTGFVLIILGIFAPLILPPFPDSNTFDHKNWYKLIGIIGIIAFGLLLIISVVRPHNSSVLVSYDGLYSRIRVEQKEYAGRPIHMLRRDGNHSSAVFPNNPTEHVFQYTRFIDLYRFLKPDATSLLIIGGGAYTIPRYITATNPNIHTTVTEIEPSLFPLAQKYFDLTDTSRITNHIGDARTFLYQTNDVYDVIFTDAFGTSADIPFQLTTVEYYTELKKHMSADGVFITNYIGALDTDPRSITTAMLHTLRSVFGDVALYRVRASETDGIQNLILVARNGNAPLAIDPHAQLPNSKTTLTLGDLLVDQSHFMPGAHMVFTDDKAPVEMLIAQQFTKYGR